jgi:hypothetical protein
VICDGFVDGRTRDVVHAAADLVVLSFRGGARDDSGTLVDAITFGLPVICSDDSSVAAIVRRHSLGSTFSASDAHSLREALNAAPTIIDDASLRAARHDQSAERMAACHLMALDIRASMTPTSEGRSSA